jgi:hypothetical protein
MMYYIDIILDTVCYLTSMHDISIVGSVTVFMSLVVIMVTDFFVFFLFKISNDASDRTWGV